MLASPETAKNSQKRVIDNKTATQTKFSSARTSMNHLKRDIVSGTQVLPPAKLPDGYSNWTKKSNNTSVMKLQEGAVN